jgi:undecaprenyl pyrophosphate phosphatase UppP
MKIKCKQSFLIAFIIALMVVAVLYLFTDNVYVLTFSYLIATVGIYLGMGEYCEESPSGSGGFL